MAEKRSNIDILIVTFAVIFPLVIIAFYKRKKIKNLMVQSDFATEFQLNKQFSPSPDIVSKGLKYYRKILVPLNEKLPGELIVNSWYRFPLLNFYTGGVEDSPHLTAEGADLQYFKNGVLDINTLLKMAMLLPFDQIVVYPEYLHISIAKKPRYQVVYAES